MKMYQKNRSEIPLNNGKAPTEMLEHQVVATLMNIQEKLNSPVFNGGFETLLMKVEGIEKTQQKTLDQVSELNKTIFDPDEGLYSRVKAVNQNIVEFNAWKKSVEEKTKENDESLDNVKNIVEWKKTVDEKIKIYDQNSVDVASLKDWKGSFHKALWWLIPAIGTLLLKSCVEFIIQHVVIK